MERPGIGWKARKRIEELEDPLPRQPVGDREERDSAPVAPVGQRTCGWGCDVPSGRDDANPRLVEPSPAELLREVVAGSEQDVRPPECQAIERGLRPRANGGVVDPAGWLMEEGD